MEEANNKLEFENDISKNYCFESILMIECQLSVVSTIFSLISIIFNFYACIIIIISTCNFKKIEILIFLTAILENILIIVSLKTLNLFLTSTVHFLQISVVVMVTKKLIDIYKGINHKTHYVSKM